MLLLTTTLTTAAGPLTTTPFHIRGGHPPSDIALQANFSYGSGTAAVTAWVQTSIDGVKFFDVAAFGFDTSSVGPVLFNLTSSTPVTSQYTPTDGTLDANTCVDGFVGNLWRVKYTSTGDYDAAAAAHDGDNSLGISDKLVFKF